MKQAEQTIGEIFADGRLVDEALKRAVREAILRHKLAGNPIVVWEDGKTVWIQPENIELPEEHEEGSS